MTWRKETKKILNILRTLARKVSWSQPAQGSAGISLHCLQLSAVTLAAILPVHSPASLPDPLTEKRQCVYVSVCIYTHTHAHTSYHGLLLKAYNQIPFRKPHNDQFVSRPLRNWHVIEYFIYFFLSCKNNYFNILGKVFCCCLGFC